jgi:hypothetical protein
MAVDDAQRIRIRRLSFCPSDVDLTSGSACQRSFTAYQHNIHLRGRESSNGNIPDSIQCKDPIEALSDEGKGVLSFVSVSQDRELTFTNACPYSLQLGKHAQQLATKSAIMPLSYTSSPVRIIAGEVCGVWEVVIWAARGKQKNCKRSLRSENSN